MHVGPIRCGKYSLKSEILDENSTFPTFYTRLLYFMLYSDDTNGHMCTPSNVHVLPINLGAFGFLVKKYSLKVKFWAKTQNFPII